MKKIFVLVLLCTTALIAQPRGFRGGWGEPRGERLMEQLNLTAEQEDQFKQLRSDFEKKNIELRSKVQTLRLDLRDMFDDAKPGQEQIESQITAVSKAENELKLNMTAFWFNVNKILKPDQQKLWKEHAKMMLREHAEMQAQERFHERMGMRHPGTGFWGPGRGSGRHNDGVDQEQDDSEKPKDDSKSNDDGW